MATEYLTERPPEEQRDEHNVRQQVVSEETFVLRNYDGNQTHVVTICCYDANNEIAFHETYTLDPQIVTSASIRLQRAVYRVTVQLDSGKTDTADCLLGSGPNETALVEVGNGLVSVVDGLL